MTYRFRGIKLLVSSFSILLVALLISGPLISYGLSTSTKSTQTPKTHYSGLYISPTTNFLNVNAGLTKTNKFSVANYTSSPITVTLSVKQFSVNDYNYSFNFNPENNNWITLGINQVNLSPGQNQQINYQISVPKGTSPGGYYYTFIASATYKNKSLKTTIQAASLLYLTINGKLVRTSTYKSSAIQHIMFGSQIAYKFNVINTGNVYFFIYVSGKLHGLSVKPPSTQVAHILIPGKVRSFTGYIEHPVIPGIYKATYGYSTNSGQSYEKSTFILYVPPWSLALVILVLLFINIKYNKKPKNKDKTSV